MKQIDANATQSELGEMENRRQLLSDNDVQSRSRRSSSFYQLIEACKRKHLELVRSIVSERPALVNQKDKHNRSLLHYTAILVQEDTNGKCQSQRQELFSQADGSVQCLNYITDRCELKLWWQQDLDGLSVLHFAVISSNTSLVKHLVYEHQHSVKYPLVCLLDNELHSPLHWAVITNNLENVKLLVGFGGTKLAHEPDLNGATPLHYATQTSDYPRYRKQLKLMLKSVSESVATIGLEKKRKGDVDNGREVQEDDAQSRVQELEMHQRGLDILEHLIRLPQINLELVDKDRRTPLLWAASSGNRDAIILLLTNGANVISQDLNGLGALHCAASHGFTDCLECLLDLASPKFNLIDQPDNLNCTPLFYCVLSGNIDCVETLLERGAKEDWQDTKGRTAAHFAAFKGQLNSLKLLQDKGANLWLANKQGDLPLHYAIKNGRQQVVRWLLAHSPYEHAVNAINNVGRAPIHLAVLKGNAEMTDYLIRCGANLNQLVKVREKGSGPKETIQTSGELGKSQAAVRWVSQYHYETALDMAANLDHRECLQLLAANRALPATQVINQRAAKGARSLFDIQSVEGISPIGFETSSSSASNYNANEIMRSQQKQKSPQDLKQAHFISQMPKVARPAPDSLPQTDSTGSSALSQSSLTSVRGLPAIDSQKEKLGEKTNSRKQQSAPIDTDFHENYQSQEKPFKGGISYNNELINASIKCKLYGSGVTRRSYPEDSCEGPSTGNKASSKHPQSAPICSERHPNQEIITNVNVYTPTCAHCLHHQLDRCSRCSFALDGHHQQVATSRQIKAEQSRPFECSTDESSDGGSEIDLDVTKKSHLPTLEAPIQQHQQHLIGTARLRHLPPSQSHEQHLPAIMSEHERSTSGTSNERSPESPSGLHHDNENLEGRFVSNRELSGSAQQEPRFDWSERPTRRVDRYREQVRSPVADYIHAPYQSHMTQLPTNDRALQKQPVVSHHQFNKQKIDYSQVRAKVDSHRDPDDPMFMSKSSSNLAEANSRSVSRSTFLRGHQRSGSADSGELTTSVERSIRKYKQETKLFEELQNLKRSQIRSGRANEALLVKRLVEHFRKDTLDLLGLESYHGPYNYEAYESYLYNQLRRLSQSNCAKLGGICTDSTSNQEEVSELQRNQMDEEDLKAELELRRVVGDSEVEGEHSDIQLDTDSRKDDSKEEEMKLREMQDELIRQLGEVTETKLNGIPKEHESGIRSASVSSVCSSRRSSVDVEKEKLDSLPLKISQAKSEIEEEARDLSSSIVVDALGNISRAGSVSSLKEQAQIADDAESGSSGSEEIEMERPEMELSSNTGAMSPYGRRKSLVNIGNKMELIYHDVGIEIEPPADSDNASLEDSGSECCKRKESETSEKDKQSNRRLSGVAEEGEEDGTSSSKKPEEKEPFEEDQQEPELDGSSKEIEEPGEDLQSEKQDTLIARRQLQTRRASSPSNCSSSGDSNETIQDKVPLQRRRAKSVYKQDSSEIKQKKVFDGNDLDNLRKSLSRIPHANQQETSTESSKVERQEESTGASNEVNVAIAKPRASRTSRTSKSPSKPKRPRSTIPVGVYEVLVPVEDVRLRWAPVKAEERKRKRLQDGTSEGFQTMTRKKGGEMQKQVAIPSSKSQPNIEGASKVANSSKNHLLEESFMNFTLLYEINKCSMSKQGAGTQGGSASSKRVTMNNWCPKKLVRIVDVRTLKRTLSLPDSIIYSNDLLKRFNILKL